MSNITKDKFISGTKLACGAAAGLIGLLVLKYPDCAVFDDFPEDMPRTKGYPLIGTTIQEMKSFEYIYSAQLEEFEKLNTLTKLHSGIGLPFRIITIDPKNVEYFLKRNALNYEKGDRFKVTFRQLFGRNMPVTEGTRWAILRKLTVRIYNVKRIEDSYVGIVVHELNEMTKHILDVHAQDRTAFDIGKVISRFVTDSFVVISFGKSLRTLTQADSKPLVDSFDKCIRHTFELFTNPLASFAYKFRDLFRDSHTKSIEQHYDTLNEFAYTMIAERRKNIEDGHDNFDDLLSLFMNELDENEQPFSDKDLRDMIVSAIVAGRDTTVTSITWTIYCLTQHPHVQDKLVQEIETFVSTNGDNEEPLLLNQKSPKDVYQITKKMTYAHAVFFETLRLYPPGPTNIRVALNDDVWPDGTRVRKGDTVATNHYAQARTAKIWGDDCREFKPERWIENGHLRQEPLGKWPLFGCGPRACMGKQLATLEAIAVIATLVQRYKITLAPGQNVEYFVSFVLEIKNGLQILLERR
ncbi:cytochrome P450 [Phascolomyces articulosus]|uniref:Cytochrome P450 n=1 Tax=Phascolomyces articulosus TaxID=60185 RepID=A0AAD5KD97_9FUNG|nr:cytochrome P450 [Phascolomyces articulosus]